MRPRRTPRCLLRTDNQAGAARTAAIQMGRLGSGLAGQQAVAGLQERNQAQQNYGNLLGAARGQDAQAAIGGYNAATSAYGGGLNGQPTTEKSNAMEVAPYVAAFAKAMSDRRTKTNISDGSGQADKVLSRLTPYNFSYKDPRNGAGPQLGIMAQDLERAGLKQAVVNTPAGKMVDEPANTNVAATLADVPKDVMIRIRVTEEDRERWQAAADADQRTLSDWLRIVANAASANVKAKRRKARS